MPIAAGPRILSVRQPLAWAIMAGKKKIENRNWSTAYRGLVLIHAAKTFSKRDVQEMRDDFGFRVPDDLPRGAIIGACTLKDVIAKDREHLYSPWFIGPYGFVLSRPRRLPRPIPLVGRLGLWQAPPDVMRKVRRQIPTL